MLQEITLWKIGEDNSKSSVNDFNLSSHCNLIKSDEEIPISSFIIELCLI